MSLDFKTLIEQKDEVIQDYRDKKYQSIVGNSDKIKVFGLLAVLLQPIRHHLAEVFKRYLGRFQLQFVAQYREVRLKPLIPVENVSVKSSGISLFYQRESA